MMCRFQKCKKIFFENFYYARPAPMVMGRAMGAPMVMGKAMGAPMVMGMAMALPMVLFYGNGAAQETLTKSVPTDNYGLSLNSAISS